VVSAFIRFRRDKRIFRDWFSAAPMGLGKLFFGPFTQSVALGYFLSALQAFNSCPFV
jgi:hypothetical protein